MTRFENFQKNFGAIKICYEITLEEAFQFTLYSSSTSKVSGKISIPLIYQ